MERKSDNLREAFGYFGDLDQPKTKAKSKKYDIEVTNSLDSLLGELAKENGLSKEKVVSNALASYAHLQNELKPGADGRKKRLVIRNDKEILQHIELP